MDALAPSAEEWRELETTHAWQQILLPYILYLEQTVLRQMQSLPSADPQAVLPMVGALQMLHTLREAPTAAIRAQAMRETGREEPGETDDGRRRDLFERFRRGLRGARLDDR